MDVLDHVIQNCIPEEWEGVNSSVVRREDFQTHTYHLFDLTEASGEYLREIEAFRDGDLNERVTQIQRVQNPFHLGRFLLRKEQLKFRRVSVHEAKYYHPLKNHSQLVTALEYNMDIRRYENACTQQMANRNPLFYKKPKDAVRDIFCQYILVCIVIDSSYQDTVYKMNDTEYMPLYVVKLR